MAYVIVNEAGASVYSTSQMGREEFPEYDATLRGAVSIGRRLLDPLSELVKIEPANIGVGLYQHDVKAKHLEASLDEVVESCVNYVGVDVNTASPALLRYVSGLNQLTARRVYEYRREHGPFRSREQLREVPGFGEATFVQAAGFLKIAGGENPLDATWIHPESYAIATQVLERFERQAGRSDRERNGRGPGPADGGRRSGSTGKGSRGGFAEQGARSRSQAERAPSPGQGAPPGEGTQQGRGKHGAGSSGQRARGRAYRAGCGCSAGRGCRNGNAAGGGGGCRLYRSCGARRGTSRCARNRSARSRCDAAWLTNPVRGRPRNGRRRHSPCGISWPSWLGLDAILARTCRAPVFKQGVLKLEDLTPGMELTGTVLNVVDFGCFVDIGMHDSGLVHVSRLADRFIRDPHEVVAVGDIVKVWVMEVDKERRRVSLTMVRPGSERPRRPARGDGENAESQSAGGEQGQRRRSPATRRTGPSERTTGRAGPAG